MSAISTKGRMVTRLSDGVWRVTYPGGSRLAYTWSAAPGTSRRIEAGYYLVTALDGEQFIVTNWFTAPRLYLGTWSRWAIDPMTGLHRHVSTHLTKRDAVESVLSTS